MAKRQHRKGASVDEIKVLLLKPRLRIDEVAILLSVTPRTVSNYVRDEKLTSVALPGGQRRIVNDETLRRYI
jgi:excisionase family DNA binding protein